MNGNRAAIWARVSTTDQHTENQLHVLRQWASDRGFEVVAEFITEDSAWANGNGAKGAEFDQARQELLAGAHHGKYQVVLIWALDRLSRRGYDDLNPVLQALRAAGCELMSHQEQWLHTLGPFGEIVIHMLALIAEQESARRSERIKAGLTRRKREGHPVGGSKKGRKRKSAPQAAAAVAGWSGETGRHRREALAARNKARTTQNSNEEGREDG